MMVPPDSAFHSQTFSRNSSRPMLAAAGLLALHQLALDHHLGRDAGMVGAGLPQHVLAAHALEAAQDVLQRVVERVAHVQRAGDVRRRDDDAVGLGAARARAGRRGRRRPPPRRHRCGLRPRPAGRSCRSLSFRFLRVRAVESPPVRILSTPRHPLPTKPRIPPVTAISPPAAQPTPTRAIVLLALAGFASQAMVRVDRSLLPQIAADFGTTVGAASIVVTAYALTHGSVQLFIGPIGDRFGKYLHRHGHRLRLRRSW